MDQETTYGVSPQKLAKLLNLADAHELPEADDLLNQAKAELLEGRLEAPLPPEAAGMALPPALAGSDAPPLGRILQDHQVDLATLESVKQYGKLTAAQEEADAEQETATAVYYAAIAAALVHHDRRITSHSFENLRRSFAVLAETPWMSPAMAGLFQQAHEICRKHIGD